MIETATTSPAPAHEPSATANSLRRVLTCPSWCAGQEEAHAKDIASRHFLEDGVTHKRVIEESDDWVIEVVQYDAPVYPIEELRVPLVYVNGRPGNDGEMTLEEAANYVAALQSAVELATATRG